MPTTCVQSTVGCGSDKSTPSSVPINCGDVGLGNDGKDYTGLCLTDSNGKSICYYCPEGKKPDTSNTASPTSGTSTLSSAAPASTSGTPASTSSRTVSDSTAIPAATAPVADSKTVSIGAASGIGIGCALIGALLAGLIVLFLVRRKQKQQLYSQQHLPTTGFGYLEQEKHGMNATSSHVTGGLVTNIDRLLPQPAEDDAIVRGLSKIRDGVKNHVQNYYHNAPVNHNMVDVTRLSDLASATGISAAVLRDLLLNPVTRISATKLFLGHLILSRCREQMGGKPSLLPDELSSVAASTRSANGTENFQTALFSKWKVISGALLQQRYGQHIEENDPRHNSIMQVVTAADPVLHPFISPNVDATARRRNLEGIARRAAQYAFLLFSQPGIYQFDYAGTGDADSLVVFPALLQTISDAAEPLLPPRLLSEKEIVGGLQQGS